MRSFAVIRFCNLEASIVTISVTGWRTMSRWGVESVGGVEFEWLVDRE
jgi:hypothetical protein